MRITRKPCRVHRGVTGPVLPWCLTFTVGAPQQSSYVHCPLRNLYDPPPFTSQAHPHQPGAHLRHRYSPSFPYLVPNGTATITQRCLVLNLLHMPITTLWLSPMNSKSMGPIANQTGPLKVPATFLTLPRPESSHFLCKSLPLLT